MAGTVAKKARSDWWSRVDQSALEAELDSRLQMANGKWQTACFDTILAHDRWHPGICHLVFVIWHLSSGIL
jgi:hypothetical protein